MIFYTIFILIIQWAVVIMTDAKIEGKITLGIIFIQVLVGVGVTKIVRAIKESRGE